MGKEGSKEVEALPSGSLDPCVEALFVLLTTT